jgi:DNA polymerase III delta prime subunit
VYLLADAGRMTVQAQNALLKFAEEPVKDAYIVMTVQHPDEVLPTIKSRAKMYRLGYYTVTELQHFTDDELLLSVCENPGQIKRFELARIEHLMDHCNRILDSLDQIRASNVFRILSYVEPEELDLLLPLLIEALRQRAGGTERELWVDLLRIVYKYKGRMLIKGLNQQNLLETMLIEMRERAWTSET